MAKIDFMHGLSNITNLKTLLEEGNFAVHANILNVKVYEELLELGFNPENFEDKNKGNKILIDGVYYKNI